MIISFLDDLSHRFSFNRFSYEFDKSNHIIVRYSISDDRMTDYGIYRELDTFFKKYQPNGTATGYS